MRRAVILGLGEENTKLLRDFLKEKGFAVFTCLPNCILRNEDVVICFPGPITPGTLDEAYSEIRFFVGNNAKIIFLGKVSKKMYMHEAPVIPFDWKILEELL